MSRRCFSTLFAFHGEKFLLVFPPLPPLFLPDVTFCINNHIAALNSCSGIGNVVYGSLLFTPFQNHACYVITLYFDGKDAA